MRYVIAVVGITLFILWEVIYDDWQVTRDVVAEISRLLHMAGL